MATWMRIALCLLLASFANADCDADVDAYIQALSNPTSLQLWSLEMFDSSTKFITDGVFELSFIFQFANFDQCLAVNGPQAADGQPRFIGQYCFFNGGLRIPLNDINSKKALQVQQNLKHITEFRKEKRATADSELIIPSAWGVCAPSSCGSDGVKRVADFNMQLFASTLGSEANTTIWPNSCYHNNDGSTDWDVASWCFIAFVFLLVVLIVVSTLIELMFPTFGFKSITNAFSLKQTLVRDLMRIPEGNVSGHLGCLHGVRTLSMLWVILSHSYSLATSVPVQNLASFTTKFMQQWYMAPILNGYLAVDTFFLLSGLLTVYVPLMDLAKGRKFNVIKYYLYRYLRITIPFAVFIWFMSTVFIYTGNGPIWHFILYPGRKICQDNWWANLLYISNYFFEFCMGHTWYLCVDMQLALLAPLIIYPLMRWPKIGLIAILFLTLGSVAAVFAVTYTENLPWTAQLNVSPAKSERYWNIIYMNTPMRASPYLIGMALGYFLSKKHHVSLPKWVVALGWFGSTALTLTVIFLVRIPYSDDYVPNAVKAAFYSSLHRPAWSISLCWIIWACVNGYGGFVNTILSWKYFVPLSKLTFCAYLVHLTAMNLCNGLRRTPYFVSHFENWYLFSGFTIVTLPYTVALYLMVEAPSMNLMRLAFKKRKADTAFVSDKANKTLEKES